MYILEQRNYGNADFFEKAADVLLYPLRKSILEEKVARVALIILCVTLVPVIGFGLICNSLSKTKEEWGKIQDLKALFNRVMKKWKQEEKNSIELEKRMHNAIVQMVIDSKTYPQAENFLVSLQPNGVTLEPAPAFGEEKSFSEIESVELTQKDNVVSANLPEGYYINYKPTKSKEVVLQEGDVIHDTEGKFLFRFQNNKCLICDNRRHEVKFNEASIKFEQEGYFDDIATDLFIPTSSPYIKLSEKEFARGRSEIRHAGIVITPEKDKILREMILYLRAEFAFFNYSPKEKLKRISHFVSVIFSQKTSKEGTKDKGISHLGDYVGRGSGVCRHQAALVKALGDALDISIGLVHSGFPDEKEKVIGHIWCVSSQNGKDYILDPTNLEFFNRVKATYDMQELLVNLIPQINSREHLKKILCEQYIEMDVSIVINLFREQKFDQSKLNKLKPLCHQWVEEPDPSVLEIMLDILNKYDDKDSAVDAEVIKEFEEHMVPICNEFKQKVIEA